ncbi:hypothetical protein VNO80_01255 [Phaseolus coccineus]|uniref:Uncharacterized protein n=1 Tax=Phaseolus coccineus TaxID=3886 RepID=A0AAN9RSJ4_PHACN
MIQVTATMGTRKCNMHDLQSKRDLEVVQLKPSNKSMIDVGNMSLVDGTIPLGIMQLSLALSNALVNTNWQWVLSYLVSWRLEGKCYDPIHSYHSYA